MTHVALESLETDQNLQWAVAIILTPRLKYDAMRASPIVQAARDAWIKGEITQGMVETFVDRLMLDFKKDYLFPYNHTLMALCVMFEPIQGSFARNLIDQCARLYITETEHVCNVARYARKGRFDMSIVDNVSYVFLDDERVPEYLNDGQAEAWTVYRTAEAILSDVKNILKPEKVMFSLDHDLGEDILNGYEMVHMMIELHLDDAIDLSNVYIQVHSANPVGRDNINRLWRNFEKSVLGRS